jgi:hypothetical protein
VYPEPGFNQPWSVFAALLFHSAAFGLWAWGLIGLSRRERVGAWVVLVLAALFGGLLGLGTIVSFCPIPCELLSPVGDIWSLATTITSLAAIVGSRASCGVRPSRAVRGCGRRARPACGR